MPDETAARVPVGVRLSEAETIAHAYYYEARRDGWAAPVLAIEYALSDLDGAEAMTGSTSAPSGTPRPKIASIRPVMGGDT